MAAIAKKWPFLHPRYMTETCLKKNNVHIKQDLSRTQYINSNYWFEFLLIVRGIVLLTCIIITDIVLKKNTAAL